jgi:type VI secretion system secreted protein Hcp
MAVDYFLKIDGIQGESLDAKHPGEIEIESFSWGLTQTGGNSAGGGGGAGKAQFRDVSFVALITKASPLLFLGCASGNHFKSSVLTVRKPGESQTEFYTLTFEDVVISSYQQGSSQAPGASQAPGGVQGDVPVDQFSFNFSKIEVVYRPQRADGALDAPVRAGWDVKNNAATPPPP